MEKTEEKHSFITKIEIQTSTNIALLALVFGIFTLIITLKPEILKTDMFLTLQLVLSIPLFMSSTLARLKLLTFPHAVKMDKLAHASFLTAYSFLINSIGILIAIFISVKISSIFFAVNILAALVYSCILTSYDRKQIMIRVSEDGYFFLSVFFLGLLHSINL